MNTKLAGGRTPRRHTTKVSPAPKSPVAVAASICASRVAERNAKIAEAAYFRAQQRGFEPGHELEDWLAAELDVTNLRRVEDSLTFQD